jgi:hypothetical protein
MNGGLGVIESFPYHDPDTGAIITMLRDVEGFREAGAHEMGLTDERGVSTMPHLVASVWDFLDDFTLDDILRAEHWAATAAPADDDLDPFEGRSYALAG